MIDTVDTDLGDIIVSLATKGGIIHDAKDDINVTLTVSYPSKDKSQEEVFQTYELSKERLDTILGEADILRAEIEDYVREETARREIVAREEAKKAAEKEAAKAEKRKQYQAAAREKRKAEKTKKKGKKTLDL